MKQETIDKAVREYCRPLIDDDTWHLIAGARFDLWHGPMPADESEKWPGFSPAIDRIADALEGFRELWINEYWAETQETEPEWEGEYAESEEDWYRIERRDIIRAIVGKDLAEYVR